MATNETPKSISTSINRTVHVQINTPYGGVPLVDVYRETVHLDSNQAVVFKESWTSFRRTYTQALNQSVTLASGKTLTGSEMYEAISLFCDMWKLEESSIPAPAPAPTPQP